MHALGLVEAVRAIRAGALDATAYRAGLRARTHRLDPTIQAFARLAEPTEEPPDGGPFAGVPVAIKDIIDTVDLTTSYGSPAYADHVPACDAWVVARLHALGAAIPGKTHTTEFAWRHPGPTANPWAPEHTPGGSSSGSAAAVAAGLVPLALGTQTFGSVIRPAAYCGVVGVKPSYGAIPRTGVHPLAGSLDHVGLFARSVGDAAYALALLAAADAADRHGQPLPPFAIDPVDGLAPLPSPRLALVRTALWNEAQPEQRALVEATAGAFAAAGARVTDLALPDAYAGVPESARTILAVEAGATFAPLVARAPDLASAPLRDLVEEGRATPAFAYVEALRRQAVLRRGFTEVIGSFDAILTLPASGAAPRGLAFTGDPAFCVPWTYLGVPAVTLPAGEHEGLPLGIQLVGSYRGDLRLLRIAAWCERVLARPVRFPTCGS